MEEIVIIGAGASGLFCAAELCRKGCKATVIDIGERVGRKVLITGGGKCNFTNLNITPENYISENPHFCKSALSRYTQWDFIDLINRNNIIYHERANGELFCDNSAQDIVNMLMDGCKREFVKIRMNTELFDIAPAGEGFKLKTSKGDILAGKVVVSTGGLTLPKSGSTPIGYKIAETFNLPVIPVRAGLVPLTLHKDVLDVLQDLSGIAVTAVVKSKDNTAFKENLLFTHRGLSGPAVLQISNYWKAGEPVTINLVPDIDIESFLLEEVKASPTQALKNVLAKKLPKRLVECLQALDVIPEVTLNKLTRIQREGVVNALQEWEVRPNGTEGYRTAEITLGGVGTNCLSSKTMAAKNVDNLYFIGEVVDVTGWLGGYNLQWCWSSAWACADNITGGNRLEVIQPFL